MDKFLFTLGVIAASLAFGYAIQRLTNAGRLRLPGDTARLRQRMQAAALFVCIPASAMLSLWGMPAPDVHLLALPLFGLIAWTAGGILAVALSRCLRLDPAQTGSMYCCGTFTNIGAIGGLVCTLYLGEQSIALVALYRLCEEFYFFGVAYPVARAYGARGRSPTDRDIGRFSPVCPDSRGSTMLAALGHVVRDPVIRLIFSALLLGVLLNVMGVPRFPGAGFVASGCILAATVLFLTAIGMSLRISRMRSYLRPLSAIALIKFLLVPALMTGLARLTGLGEVDDGLPLRTVFLLSSMPVAMNALVPPSLFSLDLDLANTCWIGTTALLIIVLPLLALLLPYI